MKHTKKISVGDVLYYVLMISLALISLFPIYFAFISSVKVDQEVFAQPFLPTADPQFSNFVRAMDVGNIGQSMINTIFVTMSTVVITIFTSALAGYILAKYHFKIKSAIYSFFLAGMMVPIQTVIIPLSFYLGYFKLFDNYLVLILLFSAFQIPMSIFIITGFMKSMPNELEEAAIIDGSTETETFFKIILPLSAPALASTAIFAFINIWNNLLFPLIFIRSKSKQLIALSLQAFFGERSSDYGGVMAAIVISILPTVITYILLQEKVEKGLTAGAVKG